MLQDVDSSLEALFSRELAQLEGQVGLSFAPPDESFPPDGVSLPVANLFLYDIRENREMATGDRSRFKRESNQAVPLPEYRWINGSYLVTAWTSGGDRAARDEHLVLGLLLSVVLRNPVLPDDVLRGSLKEAGLPVRALPIQSEGMQSMGDFWRAMGGKPKAALGITVTFAAAVMPATGPRPLVRKRTMNVEQVKDA